MRTLSSFALVLAAAGLLAAWGSAGTNRVAAIADSSTSWAEFSSRVPDLRDALAHE